MNREEAHQIISSLLCGTHKKSTSNHYRDVALGIDKIYDDFEKDLRYINNQVLRLKKQLASNHHVECSCSFCKPVV